MQSAIISYTPTVAMLIPVSGWLADRFGTRVAFHGCRKSAYVRLAGLRASSSLSELVIASRPRRRRSDDDASGAAGVIASLSA